MIAEIDVDTALSLGHATPAAGTAIEHEIDKQRGKVTRRRQYLVYLPAGYTPKRQYPLVMVLHGCHQQHQDIRAISGFDAIADRVGAIVVYPFVTSYSGLRSQNCWGWWLNRQRQRGRGEVADLRRIAIEVSEQYSVNPQRRHICGLSAGGAMSVACLAAYSDFWTSGASIAGVPFGESSRAVQFNPHVPMRVKSITTLTRLLGRELVGPAPPLLVIQSQADRMVLPVLGANLRDSWINVTECDSAPTAQYNSTHLGIDWRFQQFGSGKRLHVAHFLVSDLEHGWPGGLPGKYSTTQAPNVSELIWLFFDHCAQH